MGEPDFRRVELQLDHAARMLAVPASLTGQEWMLLATILAEADLLLNHAGDAEVDDLRALFSEVFAELRDATDGFSSQEFLNATTAARRRNPDLFTGARGL